MPEREGEIPAEAAASEESTCTLQDSDASVEQVSWPVEDPSEFRPEFGPGGVMESLGKEKEEFRVYYEVYTSMCYRFYATAVMIFTCVAKNVSGGRRAV